MTRVEEHPTLELGARVFVATDVESAPWWLKGRRGVVTAVHDERALVQLDDGNEVTVELAEIRRDRRRQNREFGR